VYDDDDDDYVRCVTNRKQRLYLGGVRRWDWRFLGTTKMALFTLMYLINAPPY